MVHYHNLSWYGTIVYHGLPVSIYRGSTMVYPGKTHGIPWFTSFKIPWYTMHFTMVYQFQNTVVYHAFYHGLPVSKYHGVPWYTMHFTMVYQFQNTMVDHGIPWVLPWFTSFKIPWYNLPWYKYTMVQLYHGIM